jgi:tripartite-type tricarboxylate transporter receptor subunit TctC
VPKRTPPAIIDKLNRTINAGLVDRDLQARLADVGSTPIVFTPAEFGRHVTAEIDKWGRVVKSAGARPE